jgi:hypothetical protein
MEVNKQLDKMGYNIGLRLIEDFLAKTNTGRCANFRETAEIISKVRALLDHGLDPHYLAICLLSMSGFVILEMKVGIVDPRKSPKHADSKLL